MNRLEELTQRELEGGLSRKESRELQALLDDDPQAETRYRQLLEVEVELRNLDRQFDVADAVMKRVTKAAKPKKRPTPAILETLADRWFYRIAIPAGLAAALVISLVLIRGNPFDVAEVAGIEGTVKILRDGEAEWVSQGVKLRPNDRVVAPPDSTGALHYRDKTRVELDRGTEVIFEPDFDFGKTSSKRLKLVAGRIEADVAKQPAEQPFVIGTPHAFAIVRGTQFSLDAGEEGTRIVVREGQVDLRRATDGATVAVRGGMFATAGPDRELAAKPLRVRGDLVALYTFQEGRGSVVRNRAKTGENLDVRPDSGSASWVGRSGLRLGRRDRLETGSAADAIRQACQESRALTVEAWIEPKNAKQEGPARIVTHSHGSVATNFLLGQHEDRYVFRLRTSSTQPYHLVEAPVQVTTKLTHLVFTRTPAGDAKFYIDGKIVAKARIPGHFGNWHPGVKLALGDDPSGEDRSWLGVFRLAAIYSKALTEPEVQRNFASGPEQSADFAVVRPQR